MKTCSLVRVLGHETESSQSAASTSDQSVNQWSKCVMFHFTALQLVVSPSLYLLLILLVFSPFHIHCATWAPPHEPACSHLSLWLRVQGTAKEIPPTEKPEHFWQTNVVSNSSRLSQSPYNLLRHKSSHRKHELETTAKCLGGGCSCGEGGVHFTKLTQRLLSGMTDGEREDGWWMRARTAVFLLVLPQRSENPVDDPNPTCCHNWLPGVQVSRCPDVDSPSSWSVTKTGITL